MHQIVIDPALKLVEARLAGFLSEEDVEAFFGAEQDAARSLGCGTRQHLFLVDATDFVPQTPRVVTVFADAIERRSVKPRRAAIAVGSALATLQIRRMTAGHAHVAVFDDAAAARTWLLDGC